MNSKKKIAEILEGLEKVMPWPWKIADTTDGYVLLDADDRELAFFDSIGRADVARFIVNVPEWIRFLLDELDRSEKELELFDQRGETIERQLNIIEQLQEESRKLRKELDLLQELAVKVTVEREKERKYAQQEIERLRQLYECEREIAGGALEQVKNLREERRQDRQWIEKASENVTQLQKERDKLIEVLRWYADKTNYVQEVHHLRHGTLIGPAEAIYYDDGQRARNILREIGVTVDVTGGDGK